MREALNKTKFKIDILKEFNDSTEYKIVIKVPHSIGWIHDISFNTEVSSYKLEHTKNEDNFTYFEAIITLPRKALYHYYFTIKVNNKTIYFKNNLDNIDTIKKEGINKVLVYCNSLSSAVDFDYLSKEKEIKIITPFDVYKKEATNYKSIAVISANAVATSNIERVMLNYNKDLHIVSVANLQLVWSIENGLSAKKIIEKHKLKELCDWFKDNGSEALLLGCTHFPYLYTELQKVSKILILDPTKKMIDLL